MKKKKKRKKEKSRRDKGYVTENTKYHNWRFPGNCSDMKIQVLLTNKIIMLSFLGTSYTMKLKELHPYLFKYQKKSIISLHKHLRVNNSYLEKPKNRTDFEEQD